MKNRVYLWVGVALFAGVAHAEPGSKCGLVDNWGDVDDSTTSFDLYRSDDRLKSLERIVKTLPKTVKAQLIASANSDGVGDKKVKDAFSAVKVLRENSEGAELYILKTEINGKKYSVVSYYGGGNHTGMIFPWGSSKPVAEIGDDDVNCVK